MAAISSLWKRRVRVAPLEDLGILEAHLYSKVKLRNVCEPPLIEQQSAGNSPQTVDFVSDLAYTPDGAMLVAAVGENLLLYDPNRGSVRRVIVKAIGEPVSLVTITDQRKVIVGGANGSIGIFDIRDFSKPVSIFKAHSQQIRSLFHLPDLDWIISSDPSGQVSYWFLPAVTTMNSRQDLDQAHHGTLLTCPSLSHFCISNYTQKLAVCSIANSSLFLIENLDMACLKSDIEQVTFDSGLQMHLGMNPRLAGMQRRNRIKVLSLDEYSPLLGANVSSIAHMEFIPSSPILVVRCTTRHQSYLSGIETKDWTCVSMTGSREKQQNSVPFFQNFGTGSDIFTEHLLYSTEEPRFANIQDKKFDLSNCGRVIASPHERGVRLFSFSPELNDIEEMMRQKKRESMGMFWKTDPASLHTMKLVSTASQTICCKFSPVDILLATGDRQGNVSFHQPVL